MFVFKRTDWRRPSTLIFLLCTASISYHFCNMCIDVSHTIIILNELQFYSVMLLCYIMTPVELCPVVYCTCMIKQFDRGCGTTHSSMALVIAWKMLKHVSAKMLSAGNWIVLDRNLLDATQNSQQHKHLFMSIFKAYVSINLKFINRY
jgi:hypothetical protein